MSAKILVSTEGMSYEEWLEYRRKGIGGSDASVVCGINRYKSPVELWLDKTGQIPPQEAGEAAYWGTQLETFVRAEFTKRTGIEVTRRSELLQSEEYPFMLANLDGICEVPDVGTCIFEAKTASAYKVGEWEDAIPDEYALQLAHYMAVTGYAGAYIAVLIGGNTFKWKFVERDEELISMLIELESAFWNHVQDCTPPPLDGSDASAKFLAERFHDSIPKSHITLPDTAADLLAQYDEACEQLEIVTERKQKAENLLKEMMGENEVGTAGERVITWKSVSQERLDSKTLKAEHPALCKKYTNKTSYRRFTIKAVS
jgi:putative phage-type endonuclease|nr:YqaJ viral recombinase family protein [uncultured Acetatifactor sp.]